ncbi:MAG: hypothetical protein ACRCT1_17445 [Microcoleaceae cyanobacterium]
MIQEVFNGQERLSLLEKQVISQFSQINSPVTIPELLQILPLSPPELFQAIQSLSRRSL